MARENLDPNSLQPVILYDEDGAPASLAGGGGGSATEYSEDDAAAADPSGPMTMAVRRDTLSAAEVSADGDVIAVKATAKGQLHVKAADGDTLLGAVTETAPASDTASSGLNGRLQRIAQRLSSLIALLPAALGPTAKAGALSVTTATDDPLIGQVGALTETAPASDTASSGLNGRLQRIAQRLSSLIALLPASLLNSSLQVAKSLFKTSDLTTAYGTITTATTTALVSATASQTTRLHRLTVHCAGANVLTLKSATTQLRAPIIFEGAGDLIWDFSERPWATTASNEALQLTTTTTAQVDWTAEYVKSA